MLVIMRHKLSAESFQAAIQLEQQEQILQRKYMHAIAGTPQVEISLHNLTH